VKVLINESSRHGQLFCHWTNLNGIVGILKDNTLYGNTEFRHFLKNKVTVSLSRIGTGKVSVLPEFIKEDKLPIWIRIVLDADKLNTRYSIVPYEFHALARKNNDSPAEEAVILGNGKVVITADIVGGIVYFNNDFNGIEKVVNSEGQVVDCNSDGIYELDDLNFIKLDLDYDDEGHIYSLTIYDENDEWLDSIEATEFNVLNSSDNNALGIKKIKDYIVRIEIPDILMELLEDNRKSIFFKADKHKFELDNYIRNFLREGSVEGLHGSEFKRTVKHSIIDFKQLYSFLLKELGQTKIKTYTIPKTWYLEESKTWRNY